MKKITIALVSFLTLLALAGCGSNSNKTSSKNDNKSSLSKNKKEYVKIKSSDFKLVFNQAAYTKLIQSRADEIQKKRDENGTVTVVDGSLRPEAEAKENLTHGDIASLFTLYYKNKAIETLADIDYYGDIADGVDNITNVTHVDLMGDYLLNAADKNYKKNKNHKKYSLDSGKVYRINVENQKKEVGNKKMNFEEIQNGNYSSIKGTWHLAATQQKNSKKFVTEQGAPIEITDDTLKTDAITLNKQGLKDTNGVHTVKYKIDKNLVAYLADENSVSINWTVAFYPAGTTDWYLDADDNGTNSKNTIVIWTSNNSFSEIFVQDSSTN